jgi:hypothetical protein
MRLPRNVSIGLLVTSLLFAATALAVQPPLPGEYAILGLYTTPGFDETTETWVMAAPGETFTIYAVLSHSLFGGVGGVEFAIATEPADAFGTILHLEETELPDRGLMVTTAPDYVVGYGLPVLSYTGHRVVLAQPITVLSAAPVSFFLRPYANPSLPDVMAYNDYWNPGDIRILAPAGQDHGSPVFAVNQQLVATEGATWGTVKALFE